MDRRYRGADWLEEQYQGRGLTQREVAEESGVATSTVRRWMKRHGIETREIRGEHHGLDGRARSDEVKRKISERLTGLRRTPESCKRSGRHSSEERSRQNTGGRSRTRRQA